MAILLSVSSLNPVIGHLEEGFSSEPKYMLPSQPLSTSVTEWSETAKMTASDGDPNDWFGISVDIEGNYCVIGARDDDQERGSACVFRYDGSQWVHDQKLLAPDGVAGDWFGISVAIQGEYIFVGADADDNANGINAGSVYIFKQSTSSWLLQEMILASDGTANDYFGRYISLDDEVAVIGAYYDNEITGSAYVFKRIGDDWMEEDKLVASDGEPGDYFGISTSINGQYAIIGAYRDDNINGIDAGAVYIFKRTGSGWVEDDRILASDGASYDRFGISTSSEGDSLVIGAYYDDDSTGSAYVWKNTTAGWIEDTKLLASDGKMNNFFGRSVSLAGEYMIIGAWGDTGSSGSAYVFRHINALWVEENKLCASDGANNDRFGYQVSLDGRNAVIGAYLDDNTNGADAGSAYIFTRQTDNQPPYRPTLDGPTSGHIRTSYEFFLHTTDPDGDEVYYYVDWGDHTTAEWIGPYGSDELITLSHAWTQKATYMVKAKAKDDGAAESEWAFLSISIPCDVCLNFLFHHPFLARFVALFLESFLLLRQFITTEMK